jgi:hypothetical protein
MAASVVRGRAKRPAGKKAKEGGAPLLRFKDKRSGKEMRLGTGFAWDMFFFAPVFGLPLFLRRLPHWGAGILALWLIDLAVGRAGAPNIAQAALFLAFLAVQLFLGFKGNELTARSLLAHGWSLDGPLDAAVKRVAERWRLT